jgi:polyisoprenoid-binding protein YceI
MAFRHSARAALGCAFAVSLSIAAATAAVTEREAAQAPLAVDSSHISIAGTSNIHAYTASTSVVRVTRVQLAKGVAGPNLWDAIVTPGALEAFDVAIPAASLSSPKDGLDKNMHKALKVEQFPDITFRLSRLEARTGIAGGYRAVGVLKIAGVERTVALDLNTGRKGAALSVAGKVQFLMTDFGITPPTALLGMLKTDPKITVSFETLVAVPLT